MLSIDEMLRLPESRTLEFKENLSSSKPILKTLVAFANTAGGTLIIGRHDNGKIIGIQNVLESEEKLSNMIADSIYPPLMPEIEIASVNGYPLLVVRVSHWRGPFYIKSEGIPKGVYIRLGSTNRNADEDILLELKRSIMKVSFDQLPCPEIDSSGLDKEKLQAVFSEMGKVVNANNLETLNILVPYNGGLVCSNGGLILFGKDSLRKRFFPNTEIRCARFQGSKKVHFIDRYDTEGNILDSIHEVSKFIKRNTRLGAEIEKIERKNIPEYSPIIVREILANALVHADYSLKGMNPRIAIFSDRLEIESPGMLPFGYALPDFFAGVSHIRNKVLARIFREMNIIEEWGTGFKRIKEVCDTSQYPLPIWEESGSALRVTILPHPPLHKSMEYQYLVKERDIETSPREETILDLLRIHKDLSTKEIYQRLQSPIAERTLRYDLSNMKKRGLIKMVGQGPSSRWKLI